MDDLSVALNNSGIGGYLGDAFLVFFFLKKLPIVVVRDVCPSVAKGNIFFAVFRYLIDRLILKSAWMSVRE